jgi:hypothetical protein
MKFVGFMQERLLFTVPRQEKKFPLTQETLKTDTQMREEKVKNHNWLRTLTFMAELTERLNYLYLTFEGKNINLLCIL